MLLDCTTLLIGALVLFVLKLVYGFIITQQKKAGHRKNTQIKIDQLKKHHERIEKELDKFHDLDHLQEVLPGASIREIHRLLFEDRRVTCVNLLKFFTKRSLKYGLELKHVVQLTFDSALEIAKQRDIEFKNYKTFEELPPLFGIPVSIKDHIEMKGYDTTLGSASRLFKPAEKNALMVDQVILKGGIPFCKSNLPQLLLINETNNWIVGRAENPWNRLRTTGGSSGGEAGLISTGCSPIGLGSDGGGSVRIPALLCGLYGFKPTSLRHSRVGVLGPGSYTPSNIHYACGPLGKNLDDCERLLMAMCDKESTEKYDPLTPPIAWDHDMVTASSKIKKLKIGYISNIPVCLRFNLALSNL